MLIETGGGGGQTAGRKTGQVTERVGKKLYSSSVRAQRQKERRREWPTGKYVKAATWGPGDNANAAAHHLRVGLSKALLPKRGVSGSASTSAGESEDPSPCPVSLQSLSVI